MNNETRRTVEIQDEDILRLRFMNLSGNPDQYSRKSDRNFTVVLTDNKADELESMGFNIRRRELQDGSTEASLRVFARYETFPPKIYKVVGKSITLLDESTVGSLDGDEIVRVDLVLSPYHWSVNGNTGVKAYISKAYFSIAEDSFASRYEPLEEQWERVNKLTF